MERIVEEEWLDRDGGTAADVAAALRSVSLVNRRFGGVALHARLLGIVLSRAAQDQKSPSILEVGSGRADVLQLALLRLGIAAEVILLDRSAEHLPAPSAWPAGLPTPRMIEGDALALPLADQSVDIVSCCLFLHHLEPAQVALFLREAQRVARVAVVINDLERRWLHYQLAKLNRLVDASLISRHDGPASVRRAYTRRELVRLLSHTKSRFLLERAYLFRLGAVLWCDVKG